MDFHMTWHNNMAHRCHFGYTGTDHWCHQSTCGCSVLGLVTGRAAGLSKMKHSLIWDVWLDQWPDESPRTWSDHAAFWEYRADASRKAECETTQMQFLVSRCFRMFQDVSNISIICFVFHPYPWQMIPVTWLMSLGWPWRWNRQEMPRGPCTLTHLQPCRAHLLRTRWDGRQILGDFACHRIVAQSLLVSYMKSWSKND